MASGIFTKLIDIGTSLYTVFKSKPKFTNILMTVVGFIPKSIVDVGVIEQLSTP